MKNIENGEEFELIATATFGLEAVVKREIEKLGCRILKSEDGKITFAGNARDLVRSNLWLRTADRVLLKMGEFKVLTFDELFEGTKALPWEKWIPEDGKFTVTGSSVKSKLFSVPDCQAIVKKAIAERLMKTYGCGWLQETGAEHTVKVSILRDMAVLTIDTSGKGLHKRGYRVNDVVAPIKETLASALVQLSFWKEGRLLVDPFCGSGTIPIEAAMLGKNIAPGLLRKFAAEEWGSIDQDVWKEERRAAFDAVNHDADIRILASDIDSRAIKVASQNAAEAGVEDCISFSCSSFSRFESSESSGIMICNPPYGERIGEKDEIKKIYKNIKTYFKNNPDWSMFLITSDKEFEKLAFGRPADRRRKLYNGRMEVCYYQYHGAKRIDG